MVNSNNCITFGYQIKQLETKMAILENHIQNITTLPLGDQFKMLNKQINAFVKLSRTNLTLDEQKALIDTWESVYKLRNQVIDKIQIIRSSFSLN